MFEWKCNSQSSWSEVSESRNEMLWMCVTACVCVEKYDSLQYVTVAQIWGPWADAVDATEGKSAKRCLVWSFTILQALPVVFVVHVLQGEQRHTNEHRSCSHILLQGSEMKQCSSLTSLDKISPIVCLFFLVVMTYIANWPFFSSSSSISSSNNNNISQAAGEVNKMFPIINTKRIKCRVS